MIYGGYYDYQDIYNLNVGQNPSLSFTYYDLMDTGQNFPLNLTTTMTYSNLDTSTPGYYYRVYQATDNRYYNMTFRIVFKVGNPTRGDRIPQEHVHYNYSNDWEDQLISYGEIDYINGVPQTQATLQAYTYDDQGNPTHITNFVYEGTTYEYANLSWSGRELTKIQIYNDMGINEYTIDYQYNDQGYRTNQTITYDNGSKSIDYELVDDRVIYESGKEYNQNNQEINAYDIIYTYDYDGTLISFNYQDSTHASAEYFYLRNQQGDITHIINSSGTTIIKYKYDAYGNIIDEYVRPGYQHIFDHNSYTYRGYRYDSNTELYYLNSRYYNPEVGRFINADGLLGQVGNIKSSNMFIYANNYPIMYVDTTGEWAILAAVAAITPIGWIAIAAVVVVAAVVVADSNLAGPLNIPVDEISNKIDDTVRTIKSKAIIAAIAAAAKIKETVKNNNNTRYWSATLDFSNGGPNIGRSLNFEEAVIELQEGRNVICRYKSEAWAVARAAGGYAEPVWDPKHGDINFYDHFHIAGHGEGDAWYLI